MKERGIKSALIPLRGVNFLLLSPLISILSHQRRRGL